MRGRHFHPPLELVAVVPGQLAGCAHVHWLAEDGEIIGAFAPFEVQDGNHFTAELGFLEDCGDEQVVYQLWYRQGDAMNRLEEWDERCDGDLGYADVDLSDLDGETVQFVLVVLADGSFEDDQTIWRSAQIVD